MNDHGLTEQELGVLATESHWWVCQGAKAEHALTLCGLNPTRYAQILNRLIDDPRALEHDPMTVNRLRRLRDERLAARRDGIRGVFGEPV